MSAIFIPAVTRKQKSLKERIAIKITDFGMPNPVQDMVEALELQDQRVKPLEDWLSQKIFNKPYAQLSTQSCRVVNSEINWNAIRDFARPLTLIDALVENSQYLKDAQ